LGGDRLQDRAPAEGMQPEITEMRALRRLTILLATGGMMLQTNGCPAAAPITAFATTVTAGGVLFIINRILED
jgi:hypothetical protein